MVVHRRTKIVVADRRLGPLRVPPRNQVSDLNRNRGRQRKCVYGAPSLDGFERAGTDQCPGGPFWSKNIELYLSYARLAGGGINLPRNCDAIRTDGSIEIEE